MRQCFLRARHAAFQGRMSSEVMLNVRWFRRKDREQDLERELRSDLELEAAELSGESLPHDPSSAVRRLRQLGARDCVITLGAAGCLVAGDRAEHCPAVSVQVVDTTAAGDAFTGALAVALAEGRSLTDAARFANRAAALAVTRAGAQPSLPTRAEIESLATV